MTRLILAPGQLIVKAEMDNPGGSHKYRAAKYIIEKAIAAGSIIPGQTTVIEKTGGNFGFGLLAICKEHNLQLDLAVGLSFSQRKRDLLEFMGARLIGKELLRAGLSPKEVVQHFLDNQERLGKQYFYTDQFDNDFGLQAHRFQTGQELACQLKRKNIKKDIIFVACAGTGASFTGISQGLADAGFQVRSILVEPAGCDMQNEIYAEHRLEGASVGVKAPFVDWSLVHEMHTIDLDAVLEAQRWFFLNTGALVGNSSAASIAVARTLSNKRAFRKIPMVTIAYDSGLWYEDAAQSINLARARQAPSSSPDSGSSPQAGQAYDHRLV